MFSRIVSYNPKVCIWNFRITNSYLFYFSVGLYIFALNYYYKNHIKNFRNQSKIKIIEKNSGFGVVAFVGLGQLIANISLGFATQKMVAIVLMCVYSMLSFILFHFIMELHRYYYLRKHIEDGVEHMKPFKEVY